MGKANHAERELLFSVTQKDLVFQTFRAGGKGGSNANKTSMGVRFVHPPSGAVGESREERSQLQNKRNAFNRLARSPKFQAWLKLETARRNGEEAIIAAEVKAAMADENLLVEQRTASGWEPLASS